MSNYYEDLDYLSNSVDCGRCDERNSCDDDTCKYVISLNKAILKAKAFDVIKKKRVDVMTLLDCYNANQYNGYGYVKSFSGTPFLTQEEFDLIIQALEVKNNE